MTGRGALSASIAFWSALVGLVCAVLVLVAQDVAFDTVAAIPVVATTALLLAVPFAVAGVVRAGSPPVQKLAWSAVVLWAVGASAFGWALAHLMDEIA